MAFHGYNEELYSVPQYNADLQNALLKLSDAVTPASSIGNMIGRTLVDSVASSDVKANTPNPVLLDTVFLQESLSKQTTSKGVSDTIRLSDWVSIKRNPGSIPWSE